MDSRPVRVGLWDWVIMSRIVRVFLSLWMTSRKVDTAISLESETASNDPLFRYECHLVN